MLKHIVMFKLDAGVGWDDPRVQAAEASLRALGERAGVADWQVGRNVVARPHAFDLALVATFADRAALDRYQAHPAHQVLADQWRPVATWHVVDFECGAVGAA